VHSANNFADTLARWDAGSIPAFVVKMNRTARELGMDATHYTDPSGYDQASQSTPSDLLKVAALDMANPVFASFVQESSVTLPLAGTIGTYTPLLGLDGVIGVKSGFTTVAGGCDVLAVVRRVHGLPVLILGAVTGQQGGDVLLNAGLHALALANAVGPLIGVTAVVHPGDVVARVSAAGHTVTATVAGRVSMLSWPGAPVRRLLIDRRALTPGARGGTRVGSLVVTLGMQRVVIPVRLSRDLPRESLWQRIF
jgi:D-alanyl-D-alanine carboxypeptidase (penicillin-binding protein 5/6)